MKITFFIPDLNIGGAQFSTINLIKGLTKRGYKIDLIINYLDKDVYNQYLKNPLVKIIDFNNNRVYKSFFKLLSYIKKYKPDLLISVLPNCWLLAQLVKIFSKKFTHIAYLHALPSIDYKYADSWIRKNILRIAYRSLNYCDLIFCSSKSIHNEISLILKKLEKIKYIPNPVINKSDINIVNSTETASDRKKIIFIGRLIPEKGLKTFIKSYKKFITNSTVGKNCSLDIVGDGKSRRELELLVRHLDLNKQVKFLGYKKKIFKFIDKSNLIVLPSKKESFGNVIIEAMSKGVPSLVLKDSKGPEEAVAYGKTGYITLSNSIKDISEGIEKALNKDWDKELFKKHVLNFTIEKSTKVFINYISQIKIKK